MSQGKLSHLPQHSKSSGPPRDNRTQEMPQIPNLTLGDNSFQKDSKELFGETRRVSSNVHIQSPDERSHDAKRAPLTSEYRAPYHHPNDRDQNPTRQYDPQSQAQAPEDVLADPFIAAGRFMRKGGAIVARMVSGKNRKRDEKRRRDDSDDEHPKQSQGGSDGSDGYSEDGCYCCDAGHDGSHRHGNNTFARNGCWCCLAEHPHPHDPYENCQHPRQQLPPPAYNNLSRSLPRDQARQGSTSYPYITRVQSLTPRDGDDQSYQSPHPNIIYSESPMSHPNELPPDPPERDNHLSSPYSPNRTSSAPAPSLAPSYGGPTTRQGSDIGGINPPRYLPSRTDAPPSEHYGTRPPESNVLSYPPSSYRGGREQQTSVGSSSRIVPQQPISQHLDEEPLYRNQRTQPSAPSSSTSNDPRNSSAYNSRGPQPPSAYNRRSVAFGAEGNVHSPPEPSDSRPLDDRRSSRSYSYAGRPASIAIPNERQAGREPRFQQTLPTESSSNIYVQTQGSSPSNTQPVYPENPTSYNPSGSSGLPYPESSSFGGSSRRYY